MEYDEVKSYTFFITICTVTLSRFTYGFDRGALGGASLGLIKKSILSDSEFAFLVSVPKFACIFGGLLAGAFHNKYGRKLCLVVATVLYLVGLVLCVMSTHPQYYVLLLGRTLCNFSFGMSHVTSLVYLLELSPPRLRGKIIATNQMVLPLGNTMSGLVNLAVSRMAATWDWRWMLGSCLIPAVLQLMLLPLIPPSFKWLYSKNMTAESKHAASALYRSPLTDTLYTKILDADTKSDTEYRGKTNTIRKGTLARMVVVSFMLMIIQQSSGFSAVMFYSVQVAQTSGMQDGTGTYLISESIFLFNLIGVIISICLIEKAGRRQLLLSSQIGTLLSIVLIVIAIHLVDGTSTVSNPDAVSSKCHVTSCIQCVSQSGCGFCMSLNSTKYGHCMDGQVDNSLLDRCETSGSLWSFSQCHSNFNWALVISILLFVVYFSVGLSPIPFVVAAEIFPQQWRDTFTSISISVFYTATALVTLCFGQFLHVLGIKILFMVFGCFTLLGILFVYICLPDTGGTSPEKMYVLFEKPWYTKHQEYHRLYEKDIAAG